jgi:hypothetical protein
LSNTRREVNKRIKRLSMDERLDKIVLRAYERAIDRADGYVEHYIREFPGNKHLFERRNENETG